ncbi:MAG TPA: carboxypeptidase-like regulatory domain-containing protein, partial [Myxococcales bacterium]|nr:carboxypeptidase-like regulatory domain-containing protein [Myxococcales bacterium]
MKRWRTSGLVSLVLLAAAGCPSKTPPAASGDAGPRAAVDGTVTDYLGNAVAGAQLSSGGATATTASDGTYTLSGVPTPDGGTAVVAVTAAGYLDTAYGVAVTAGETTELDPVIMPMSPSQPLDATAGGTVTGVRGASLTAGPGVFVDSSGHTVSGQVDVALTPLTPGVAGLIQAYPGNLKALDASGNPVLLETHGVLDVSVEQNGQKLQIASGKTVSVTIPAAVVGALPSASGLWSFDMGTALWKAEGAATLLGTVYSAVLPHLSFWNIDCSNSAGTPVVCLRGDLRTCNGDAIIGAQITVTANDDSYATGTQGSGAFCVALPPGGGSDAGPFSDDVRCATSVSASAWDIRIQGKGLDVSVTVQAPTQGTNQGQPTFSCDVMEGAGECINLHNVGCVGDGGLLIVLDGGSSCSYWQTDGGPGAGDAGVLDPFLGTCAAPLASLFTCFNGSGGCSFDGNLDAGQITYTYANGSKETVALLGAGQANAQIGYYGPDGGLCGTVSTFGSGVDFVIGGAVYDLTSTGDVTTTITCPDGGSLTLNDDQSNT